MLPAQQPEPVHRDREPEQRPQLTLVASSEPDPGDELPFETGLMRSIAIGSLAGFAVVFALVCVALLWAGVDAFYAAASAVFVGAFGGVGFGAMEGAAIHKPRVRDTTSSGPRDHSKR